MRPKWRKELEALNLNPQNTRVEFTDSMQEEIREVIEQKLLCEPPHEETIDKLVQELYHLVEKREKNNVTVGHILLGKEPPRDPLLHGTVHVGPSGETGQYHLKYWPQDDKSEPRELEGTLNLRHLKLDLSHKSAGSKLLRSILTVRPREFSHSEADRVLNQIFTKPTVKTLPLKKTETITIASIMTKTFKSTTEKYKLFLSENPLDDFTQDDFIKDTKNIESIKQFKPTTKTKITDNENNTLKDFMVETTTSKPSLSPEVSDLKHFITPSPAFDLAVEFKKLQDTISKSRNVSATLMEEMEACERLKSKTDLEKSIKAKSDITVTPFGSWKLQQRIKDFRPQKPFPTMPPFVRRWPTFRTQISIAPATVRATLLTMRPKYGGPRHEPFFFNDFRRIRTVYPTTMATVSPKETTTDISELGKEILVDSLKTTYLPILETASIVSSVAPKLTNKVTSKKHTKRNFSWIRNYRNDTTFSSYESFTTTEPAVNSMEDKFQFNKDEKTSKHPPSTKHTTTEDYLKVTKKSFPTTTIPHVVELGISNKVFTVRPIFIRTMKTRLPRVSTTQPTTTTTFRNHIHAIKHKVKTGLKKFFSFFGFGKSNNEEQE